MGKKIINKDQVVSIVITEEKLKEGYNYYPERIYKIPLTNIVWSRDRAGWARHGRRSLFFVDEEDLKNYIVRGGKLYTKPQVKISMSSGWRDDVVRYFKTFEQADRWVNNHFSNIRFLIIYE
jgi:hypothetical protein